MANSVLLLNLVQSSWMAKPATGFHHGMPPSTRRDAALHEVAARVQAQRDDKKNTHTKTDMQCVGPETSWSCVELVHGQRHVRNWIYAKPIRSMPLLPRPCPFLGVHS